MRTIINDEPNGVNINDDCGSTHLDPVQKVVAGGYDLGIAFDGDADRCLRVDEQGGDRRRQDDGRLRLDMEHRRTLRAALSWRR